MDKKEGAASGLRSLPISDSIDRRELFGGLDRNLEVIEKNLKVDIIQRGNELLLKGEKLAEGRKTAAGNDGRIGKRRKIGSAEDQLHCGSQQ